MANQDLSGRSAARARRNAQINGKAALPASAQKNVAQASSARAVVTATAEVVEKPVARNVSVVAANSSREASRKRRLAMSSQGKKGVSSSDRQRQEDARRTKRDAAEKKDCGCGCGGTGACGDANEEQAAAPVFSAPKATASVRRNEVKVASASSSGRINSRLRRQALSLHGKTGADIFRKGVSSAQMVRQQNPDISGRELARTVRTQRSNSGGAAAGTGRCSAPVGRRRPERPSDDVSGTKVSHSDKTTGDETGLCKSVTGTDYFSSEVFDTFCQTETAPHVPAKVKTSENLSGGVITASGKVGRSNKVSGDESGSCRSVTGTEYVGREQYDDFCQSKPEPGTAKVSFSKTTRGQVISGSKPARSERVSGDEKGTCQSVTGTPYAGLEQFEEYCKPVEKQLIQVRTQKPSDNTTRDVSGIQPGISGLTGAEKGVCQNVSGTAYIGTEQQEVCGVAPAQIGESDFPQSLSDAPWGAFSVSSPAHAGQPQSPVQEGVTGTQYEQGRISGAFSLGEGKITGTEQFRFDDKSKGSVNVSVMSSAPASIEAVADSDIARITGEGIDSNLKITGNDWNRGDHVTGTEGTSAKRNPTRRGPISAMPSTEPKRNVEVEPSSSKVTGGTGIAEKGAPITLSGGARG